MTQAISFLEEVYLLFEAEDSEPIIKAIIIDFQNYDSDRLTKLVSVLDVLRKFKIFCIQFHWLSQSNLIEIELITDFLKTDWVGTVLFYLSHFEVGTILSSKRILETKKCIFHNWCFYFDDINKPESTIKEKYFDKDDSASWADGIPRIAIFNFKQADISKCLVKWKDNSKFLINNPIIHFLKILNPEDQKLKANS